MGAWRPGPTTAILASLLLVATGLGASFGLDAGSTSVEPATLSEGDQLRYNETVDAGDRLLQTARLIHAENASTARDGHGIEQATQPLLVQRRADGQTLGAERCHLDADEPRAVQRTLLREDGVAHPLVFAWQRADQSGLWTATEPALGDEWRQPRPVADLSRAPCQGFSPLDGRDLEAGEQLTLAELWPSAPAELLEDVGDATSRPAEPTTFLGREALVFQVDYEDTIDGPIPAADRQDPHATDLHVAGAASFVVADGLPGVVQASHDLVVRGWSTTERSVAACAAGASCGPASLNVTVSWSWQLAGYEPGSGPEADLADRAPTATEAASPHGGTQAGDDRSLNLPLGLSYGISEALEDVKTSPTTGYGAFAATNAHAYLAHAEYDRYRTTPGPDQATTSEGGWTFTFQDADDRARMSTARHHLAHAPDLADAPSMNSSRMETETWTQGQHLSGSDGAIATAALPDRIAAGGAIAEALERHTPDGFQPRHVEFHVQPSFPGDEPSLDLWVTDVSLEEPGREAEPGGQLYVLDARTGALEAVYEVGANPHHWEDGGPGTSPAEVHGAEPGSFSAQPGWGLGLAGTSALALLALLGKALYGALFTRKQKHELLENDVRAELVEHIREEPGVHLEALIDELGVGNGAARYHLRKLADAGIVDRSRIEGYVRFFPQGYGEEKKRRIAVLRAGCNEEVYRLLAEDDSRSIRDVASRMDRSPGTVHRAIEMLRDADLVPVTTNGSRSNGSHANGHADRS